MPGGTTIYEAARALGIAIPTLCHAQHKTPVGVCRVCTVEVKSARVLAAACIRPGRAGHGGRDRLRARAARPAHALEMLLADHPTPVRSASARPADCELEALAARAGVGAAALPARADHPRAPTTPRRSSRWTTPRASCAIAASAAATRSSTTSSSAAPARATTRRHRVRHRRADGAVDLRRPAASAWSPAPPAPSPTRAWSTSGCRRASTSGPPSCSTCRSSQGVSGTFLAPEPGRRRAPHVPAGRDHLPRGRVRLHRLLHPAGARSRSSSARRSATPRAEPRRRGRHPELLPPVRPASSASQRTRARTRRRGASSPSTRPVDLAYDNPVAQLGRGRAVRRDDLHQLLPALGHGARGRGDRSPRDAAQRALHPAAEQAVPARARADATGARARHPPAAASPSSPASPTSFIDHLRDHVDLLRYRAGPGHLPAGRPRRQLLPDPDRIREGDAELPGRRDGRRLPRPRGGTSARSACLARGARARRRARRSTTSSSCASRRGLQGDGASSSRRSRADPEPVSRARASAQNRERHGEGAARSRSTTSSTRA